MVIRRQLKQRYVLTFFEKLTRAIRVLEARGRQFGVAHGVLDFSMAEVRLQGARVSALVRKLKAASVPNMCGCALKPSFAATPSRATILRQPAVVKGEPRSPAAARCSRRSIPD